MVSFRQVGVILLCFALFNSFVTAHKGKKRAREETIDDFEVFIEKHTQLGKPPSRDTIQHYLKITQRLARQIRAEIQSTFVVLLDFRKCCFQIES